MSPSDSMAGLAEPRSVTMARWALIALLVPYVLWLIVDYHYHFLDGVNLLLHEAGHPFFSIFGDTAQFLGGTLAQLIFPAVFVGYFYSNRKQFEAYVVGIWFSESLMDAAEYIGDARAQALPLVGGHIHDWNWLLSHWGVLQHAEDLGRLVHVVASLLAVAFLLLAASELRHPRRRI